MTWYEVAAVYERKEEPSPDLFRLASQEMLGRGGQMTDGSLLVEDDHRASLVTKQRLEAPSVSDTGRCPARIVLIEGDVASCDKGSHSKLAPGLSLTCEFIILVTRRSGYPGWSGSVHERVQK